jgi:thioredoxin-related protein
MKQIFSFICVLFAFSAMTAESTLELQDVHGKSHKPLVLEGRKAAVLVFISRDCSIANAFMPEMNRLAASYEKDFAFWLVQADADISASDAKKHAEIFNIKLPVLLDAEQKLVKLTKAKMTPEAVVLDKNGETLYQGRINDLYATQTKKLREPTTHDLQNALSSILAGTSVTNGTTKAIGCSIQLK